MQAKQELEEYLNDTLSNKIFESKVPVECKQSACLLGIDEAGRGPVLGPMVYAIAYYPQYGEDTLAKMKFADSKALTETTRESLFESLQTKDGGFRELGYMAKVISPNMISNYMLRRNKYNLNQMSHDTAIALVKGVQEKGIKIAHVYIDTVGPPAKYKEKLVKLFPGVNFTVAEKADSKYPIVSAASVCAKVIRDRIIQKWKYLEAESLHLDAFKLGSGYPADPVTKKFLERSIDPVFGFPTLTRFSWSTITKALEKGACVCDWNEPDEDNEQDTKALSKQQNFFKTFVQKKTNGSSVATVGAKKPPVPTPTRPMRPRTNADKFFEDRLLSNEVTFIH